MQRSKIFLVWLEPMVVWEDLHCLDAVPNIEEAKKYFQKDLDISQEISDYRGISQMNSFLGKLLKRRRELCWKLYLTMTKVSIWNNNTFDVHASYEGKLYAIDKMNDKEKLVQTVQSYLIFLDNFGKPYPDYR